MPFSDFTNPYQNPANIPQNYRHHINLQELFKAEDHIALVMQDTYIQAKCLYVDAENLLTEAKAYVERMILGEEEVT
ncbi:MULTISPECIES: hypothetical protein [unclassified Nostoc]|uniref:hypothetical protein n=1 Tax=unclassified Nostoc TaxID=2593658 RepID=UPI002610B551|nr:hypothetical protein [Nostoc sp. S13]MDF5735204.1 hypothetical protein [Nostoc sp. S13]